MVKQNGKSTYQKIQESRKQIVDEVIKVLESGQPLRWSRGWSAQDTRPYNPVSGTVYQGFNEFKLAWSGYGDPRFCTFAQANSQGWKVKKGSRGILCEKFICERDVKVVDENGNYMKDEKGNFVYAREKLDPPIRSTFTVFNASQIEGMPPLDLKLPTKQEASEIAKDFIASSECPVQEAPQDKAFYNLSLDRIFVPPRSTFKDEQSFIATVAHEMGHSTGHKSRLDRDMSGSFRSESYAKEELVAELCSMFVQRNLKIKLEGEHIENHAAYLKSWIKALKEDHNVLFAATEKASKAADYLNDRYLEYVNQKTKDESVEVTTDQPAVERDLGGPFYVMGTKDTMIDENINIYHDAMRENGYSHNLWGTEYDFNRLGGEVKENEPYIEIAGNRIFNIEQTVGCDLNLSIFRSAPEIQDYIKDKALSYDPRLPVNAVEGDAQFRNLNEIRMYEDAMRKHGFKDNLWVMSSSESKIPSQISRLGGKIKDGEKPVFRLDGKTLVRADAAPSIYGQLVYNIEQTIGCDLNQGRGRDHPMIKAYIQEHAEEIGKIHPLGLAVDVSLSKNLPNLNWNSKLQAALHENGYKHNLWIDEDAIARFGGFIKHGEQPVVFEYGSNWYNIDQTEGCDLSKCYDPNHPQIKAYIEEQKLLEQSKVIKDDKAIESPDTSASTVSVTTNKTVSDLPLFTSNGAEKVPVDNRSYLDEKDLGEPISAFSGRNYEDPEAREHSTAEYHAAMREHGFKHNIWVQESLVEHLGGKIKDGETPTFVNQHNEIRTYNIEQTVGCDLNLTQNPSDPRIQAYIQEHSAELGKLRPLGLPLHLHRGLLLATDPTEISKCGTVMRENGYKHNIWLTAGDVRDRGGKIKEGENFHILNRYLRYYNIEQTEGCDMTYSPLKHHPQYQAYVESQKHIDKDLEKVQSGGNEPAKTFGDEPNDAGVQSIRSAAERAAKAYEAFKSRNLNTQEKEVPMAEERLSVAERKKNPHLGDDSYRLKGDDLKSWEEGKIGFDKSVATNALTGRAFTGNNLVKLNREFDDGPYSSNQWLTKDQAAKIGKEINEDAKAVSISKPRKIDGKFAGFTTEKIYNLDDARDMDLSRNKGQEQTQPQQAPQPQQQADPQYDSPYKKLESRIVVLEELLKTKLGIDDIKQVQPEVNKFTEKAVEKEAAEVSKDTPQKDVEAKEKTQDKAPEKTKGNKSRKGPER